MNKIVWASAAMLAYEFFAIGTHRRGWTAMAYSRRGAPVWIYWVWLGAHLLTGGKI